MSKEILKRLEKLEAIKAIKNSQSIFLVVTDGESEDEKIANFYSDKHSSTTFIVLKI